MHNLKVTLVQTELHWENVDANLAMFTQKLSEIEKGSTHLIVLPEMFTTGFSMNAKHLAEKENGKTIQWMAQQANNKNAVITGSIIFEEDGKYYNRLIWMRPDGTFEYYNKRHLFSMGNEHLHYSAGDKKIITELNGWKICPLVCYDLRFPVWSRNHFIKENETAIGEYDLLLYIANWPERRNHPWKTLLLARAIENQCYVAGLNRAGADGNDIIHSGDSAVINAKGEIISTIPAHKNYISTIELNYNELINFRKEFPVGLDAD